METSACWRDCKWLTAESFDPQQKAKSSFRGLLPCNLTTITRPDRNPDSRHILPSQLLDIFVRIDFG